MEATRIHILSMKNNCTGISNMIQQVPKSMKFDQHFTMAAAEPIIDEEVVVKVASKVSDLDMDDIDLENISTLSTDVRDETMSQNGSNESKLSNLTIVKRISSTEDSICDSPL